MPSDPTVDAEWDLLVNHLEADAGPWRLSLDLLHRLVAEHRSRIEAAQAVAQPERCPHCDHIEDEHRTPGGECIHAHCSCDQSWELVRDAV